MPLALVTFGRVVARDVDHVWGSCCIYCIGTIWAVGERVIFAASSLSYQ